MAIRINLNPTGSEGYSPIVELPDPLADSKRISATALEWDKRYKEATYYRLLGMRKLKDGSWVYSPTAEKPAAVVTVPAKISLTLEIDGSPDHAPTVYLFRVPPYDVVQHPYYSFPASFLIPVQPNWDEKQGKWVANVSFTTADFSSTEISYSQASLLRSNSAVFCAVATQDNGRHLDFDWVRVRLLPAKVQPGKDREYTQHLLAYETNNILENFGENLLKIYLPQGDLWTNYLESVGITSPLDRGQVFSTALSMLRDPNLRQAFVESITKEISIPVNTEYSSWLEFISTEGPKVLQNVLGAVISIAALQALAAQGIKPKVDVLEGWPGSLVQLTVQGIHDLIEWISKKPENPVQNTPETSSALDSLKLWGTLLNSDEETYVKLVEQLRTLQAEALQAGRALPTPVMYFKLPLSQPDPALSYDFDPNKSPEEQSEGAKVAYWFIGKRTDPRTGAVEYLPYLIRNTENGPAIFQISLNDVTSDDLRRAVEDYYSQMESQFLAIRNETIQKNMEMSNQNARALIDYVFQSSAQFASVLQFAKDFPSHTAQSDIWALLRGYCSWGPGSSPFSFLTGRNLPPLPPNVFEAMRDIAGQFTTLESYWKDDYYPAVRQAVPLVSPEVVDRNDPESVYAAFLLALGMNQASQLSFDITEYFKPLSYIPYLLGTWKILNYLNLKNSLRQSPKDQIFQLRDSWWQIWWTNIFEIQPGQPVFSNQIFSQLEQGFLKNPDSPNVVQLALDVTHSPDADRVPLLKATANNILIWNGAIEGHTEAKDYPLVTTSVILGKILYDVNLKSALERGMKSAVTELGNISEFGIPEEQSQEIFTTAFKALSTLSSNPELLSKEVEASGVTDSNDWTTIYQKFMENPVGFAENLGRSLVQSTFLLPSLDVFRDYIRNKFIANITPEETQEIMKSLGFPEGMSLDMIAKEFYETALNHIPFDGWQRLMVASPTIPQSSRDLRSIKKAYQTAIEDLIDQALTEARKEMKEKYGENSPVDNDRLFEILKANFYGFLFFPMPASEKFGELSVYFPFVAQMAHTEQRLAIRVGLSIASLGIGLASLASDLLGKLTK